MSRTVYVLEVGCYEQRYIAGIFANPEAAKAAHAPDRPDTPRGAIVGGDRDRHTYEWSGPDKDGGYHFGADWDDAASITPYEVHG